MAIIYRFEDFLKELDTEEIERLVRLSEKEIAELEELLLKEYGDISRFELCTADRNSLSCMVNIY